MGDVEIALQIRQDGSIESAEIVRSASPLLKEAALDSARQSKFECHECRDASTPYSVLYTFGYTTTQHCCQPREISAMPEQRAEAGPGITQSQNHITILTDPFCICDPSADVHSLLRGSNQHTQSGVIVSQGCQRPTDNSQSYSNSSNENRASSSHQIAACMLWYPSHTIHVICDR